MSKECTKMKKYSEATYCNKFEEISRYFRIWSFKPVLTIYLTKQRCFSQLIKLIRSTNYENTIFFIIG